MAKRKEKIAESEEPEEWKRFKEVAAKVMKTPPMPSQLRKVNPGPRLPGVNATRP